MTARRLILLILLFCAGRGFAQQPEPAGDSLTPATADTTRQASGTFLETQVDYTAEDSIIFANDNSKVFLYGNGVIDYGSIHLEAGYIVYDFTNNTAIAKGLIDSTGQRIQKPFFREGQEEFNSDTIKYNFKTRRGLVYGVMTEESEGYLHSELTKRHETGEIHVAKGKYTTCDLEHPHYYIAMEKAIVVPKKKIISGLTYLVIQDVKSFPLVLPFGMFPQSKKYASGIIFPQYGEESSRGFFLRDFGYYWAINDYMDLGLTGAIYSKGTWGFNAASKYRLRYRFNGNVQLSYRNDVNSEKGLPDYSRNQAFSIRWTHNQDPKANPYNTFSASVDFQTNGFNKKHSERLDDYLQSQKSSNISWRRSWPNKPFNLTANASADQNTSTSIVRLNLPNVNFNVNRLYPLKREGSSGNKWYQQLQLSYTSSLKNSLTTTDSTLFEPGTIENFRNGFQHKVPVSMPIKLGSNITLSPSLNYEGILNTKNITKRWEDMLIRQSTQLVNGEQVTVNDTLYETIVTDTASRISYAQQLSPSISLGYSPRLYGMYQFTPEFIKKRILAVRHVVNPSVSVSYRPKSLLSDEAYYRDYRSGYEIVNGDTTWQRSDYSIYDGIGVYGTPARSREGGNVNFSLGNNLEMKVRSARDTTGEYKKVKILERLNFSTGYNIFADSLNWSNISMSGGTRLFEKISLNFSGTFDPYTVDSLGKTINEFELVDNKRLARFTNARLTLNFNWDGGAKKESGERDIHRSGNPFYPYGQYQYYDFTAPWSVSVNYSLSYSKNQWDALKQQFKTDTRQTLQFNGHINFTDNWKVNFRSGYDFDQQELSPTSINIHRDLHCWEMSFEWIPFGPRQSYYFQINIKSSILKDLKYEKNERYY